MAAGAAGAQDYPARSVKIIVPFPAGGTADLMPRIVADWLSRKWKQAVVIENKPGAAGNIGAEAAFYAEPDGYTLLSAPPPPLVINQSLYPRLGFDPTAFVPISVMGIVPNALVVNPSKVSAKTVAELIAYARANPGRLTSATQGNGTTSHLTSEMFQMMAKVKFIHVPYRGSAPALAGHARRRLRHHVRQSRGLAAAGEERPVAAARGRDAEAHGGAPGCADHRRDAAGLCLLGVVRSGGAAEDRARRSSRKSAPTSRRRSGRPMWPSASTNCRPTPVGSTPEASARFMREEVERWGGVVKAAGVRLD